MALQRYGELFQESLEETIGAWGDIGTVITLVNMYQKTDTIARHYEFENWLEGMSFTCSGCRRDFSPDPLAIEEEDYVVCSKCRKN